MQRPQFANRRGVVTVEAAIVLPVFVILMLGMWEVGRFVQVNQILTNAAREGVRLAAGGYVNGTAVTASSVQTAVKNYLTAAGLPSTAVNGAQISVTCLAASTWTDPSDAQPLDPFTVSVVIPAGAPFNSLRWNLLSRVSTITQLSVTVEWMSLNNSQLVVGTTLPY